jgi:hypothetical protein
LLLRIGMLYLLLVSVRRDKTRPLAPTGIRLPAARRAPVALQCCVGEGCGPAADGGQHGGHGKG